jgi:hypothetical protein
VFETRKADERSSQRGDCDRVEDCASTRWRRIRDVNEHSIAYFCGEDGGKCNGNRKRARSLKFSGLTSEIDNE